MQQGKKVELERSGIFEIAELHDTLTAAAAAARSAAREREQRIAAEAREMEAKSANEKILEREAKLRESEERFRILLGGIKDYAIFMLDAHGQIATWNAGAERLTGYGNDEALAGSLALLYQGEDKQERLARDLRAAEQGPYEQEDWRLRKDGSTFRASVSLSALRNDDASLRGFACVIRDVSERRRLEEDLKRHVEELTASERRKDQFLATLSHELRNPIAPIRNAVQILKAIDFTEPKFVWCREVIEQQITHMARLMEDLLDVNRIMQNKLEVRKQIVSLADVIRQAVATSSPEIEAAGHRLTVMLPPERMLLEADATRLTQAFVNLLNNAAKYMDKEGQIWLGVKVAASENAGSGKEAVVRIKDNGIGISAELLPRIFNPFTQAAGADARSKGGLGIGLTLARHLIELHGGSIEAQSEGPGKGSEFIVHVPLVDASENIAAPKTAPGAPSGNPPFKRVLVVDDAYAQAKSLAMLLQVMGFQVATAHDAASALATAREFHPEVALIDIGLPGINGYQLALRLRELPELKNMVLVAQTGWGREEDREQSRRAGFNHHLTKPLDHEMLEKILTGAVPPEITR
jgi:PAS domain S-box-containing protein